ncbi:DUF4879 domain-containing protein [Dickeya undicola]|nr:DUF4879 domain-containing protein [Dickeya undicola]
MKTSIKMGLALGLLLATASSAFSAPAPALSGLRVKVLSGTFGGSWYYPPVNTVAIGPGYAGGTLQIAVVETGYGGNRIGWINGTQKKPDSVKLACLVRGEMTDNCPRGATGAGWIAYFNANYLTSVNFRYQSTSANFPYKTLSTSLNIK